MTIVFAFMVVRVHRTIFPGVRLEVDRQRRKEADTKGVADILGTMILGLTLWVTILAFIPSRSHLARIMGRGCSTLKVLPQMVMSNPLFLIRPSVSADASPQYTTAFSRVRRSTG